MMKIDKEDFDKVLKKANVPIDKKNIIDPQKYWYWYKKSDDYIKAMDNTRDDKKKFKENLHHALLCEFEKNKYCRITKKELVLLYLLVKYHNSKYHTKIYFDDKGLRVKRNDRRAIRYGSFRE